MKVRCLILLAIIANIINLFPVIQSPYLGDDSWRESLLRGIIDLTGADLLQVCGGAIKDYIRDGRWYPLVVYYHAIFYYLDRFSYKIGVIVLVIVNLLLMGHLARRLTLRRSAPVVILVIAPVFFQLRFYHDPILSYYYLMQLGLMFTQLSVIFFMESFRKSRIFYTVLAVLGYLLTLMIYEAFYPFCLIYAVVAYNHVERGPGQISKIVEYSLPFLGIALLNLGISVAVRIYFHTTYEGVTLSPDLWAWSEAFAKQVFSAIPLTYFFFSGNVFGGTEYFQENLLIQAAILVCIWSVVWIVSWDYPGDEDGASSDNKAALLIGIGFFVLPGIVVSLAAKYQRELKWGLGYLPTYISAFGLMLLFMILIYSLKKRSKRMSAIFRRFTIIATASAGALLVGVNFVNNSMVIHNYNVAEHYNRNLMEKSLSKGFLDNVPEGSYLVFGVPAYSWDSAPFYRMHSNRTFQIVKPTGFEMDWQLGSMSYEKAFPDYTTENANGEAYCHFQTPITPTGIFDGYSAEFKGAQGVSLHRRVKPNVNGQTQQVFFLKYEANSEEFGYAVLSRLKSLEADRRTGPKPEADRVLIYVIAPYKKHHPAIILSARTIDRADKSRSGEFSVEEKDLHLISSDGDSRLFEIPLDSLNGSIDPASVVVRPVSVKD